MALAGASAPADRNPSPSSLTFGSNNPFRNRMGGTSPSPRNEHALSPSFPFPNAGMAAREGGSKNPFLDPEPAVNGATVVRREGTGKASEDLDVFKELSLLDKPISNGPPPSRPPPGRRPPPPGYSSSSPQKRPEHHRRASESSMIEEKERRDRRDRTDRGERPPRTESEERRRRERRREREERHRREKERIRNGGSGTTGKDGRGDGRSKKPKNLDIIDKLDVTGIYGQGLFHHDGPFDACNPHRNAKRNRQAPMQAFPEGSANMALGGSGPLKSRIDLDKFHGRGEEGFQDYAVAAKKTNATGSGWVNPTDRGERVDGAESYGLGTSTFLDGAPASKSALQRRESEDAYTGGGGDGGGLTRKKSLAQRLRGMSNSGRARPGDLRSPEGRYRDGGNGNALIDTGSSPPAEGYIKSQSAGGARRAYTRDQEIDPFDEYDAAFERKGQQIQFADQGRTRAPSSPKANGAGLTRAVTADSAVNSGDGEVKASGGGLLNRMKSLKGGRRARPERKDSSGNV